MLQEELGFTASATHLAHEHVHERAAIVLRLLTPDVDVRAVIEAADAYVVTKAEHKLLGSVTGVAGWRRYMEIGLHPIDMNTGQPMDLQAALAADAVAWGRHMADARSTPTLMTVDGQSTELT